MSGLKRPFENIQPGAELQMSTIEPGVRKAKGFVQIHLIFWLQIEFSYCSKKQSFKEI